MKRSVACPLFGVLFVLATDVCATELYPYLYQRSGFEYKGALTLEMENALGTRDSGYFGKEGFETGFRLRYGLTDRVAFEGWGGFHEQDGVFRDQAFEFEGSFRILMQERQTVNLSLTAGFERDFEKVTIPLVRMTLNRTWGDFDFTVSGLGEFPQASWRDEADIIIGTGVSYKVLEWCRMGFEGLAEDLEGFWEKEEAEGGAKFIVGPTAWFKVTNRLECKFNTGWVHAATANVPTRPGFIDYSHKRDGFLARLAFSFLL